MRLHILIAIVFLSLISSLLGGFPSNETIRAGAEAERHVLVYLHQALKASSGVARIDYETVCEDSNGNAAHFFALPRIEARKASPRSLGLAAVREVFKNDKQIAVTEDDSGLIKITVGNPKTEILRTKLSSIKFDPSQQYNPNLATAAIVSTVEVQSAMKRLGLELPMLSATMGISEPAKGLPHLPARLENVTVEEILDLMARTFHGVAIYGTCGEGNGHSRLFWFNFRIAEEARDAPK